MRKLDDILDGLMRRYKERVPDVSKVSEAMVSNGIIQSTKEISNDHIAFRTMGGPHLGINSFEKIFLHHGYERKDQFFFEGKRLNAFWYAPPKNNYPRVFISELIVNDMSNLGRWSLIYDKNKLDNRIRMANYDNCGISHKDNIKM